MALLENFFITNYFWTMKKTFNEKKSKTNKNKSAKKAFLENLWMRVPAEPPAGRQRFWRICWSVQIVRLRSGGSVRNKFYKTLIRDSEPDPKSSYVSQIYRLAWKISIILVFFCVHKKVRLFHKKSRTRIYIQAIRNPRCCKLPVNTRECRKASRGRKDQNFWCPGSAQKEPTVR